MTIGGRNVWCRRRRTSALRGRAFKGANAGRTDEFALRTTGSRRIRRVFRSQPWVPGCASQLGKAPRLISLILHMVTCSRVQTNGGAQQNRLLPVQHVGAKTRVVASQ